VKTLGRLGLLTFTVVILPMAGVSRSWAGGDDVVVSKVADISLPLPSRVTSNSKQYDIVRDMLSNNSYNYHAGFDQKGYLINTSWEANHLGFDFRLTSRLKLGQCAEESLRELRQLVKP
jgi:hypothetical protein